MADNFIGGLLKGLAGGMEANRKAEQDKEELKLKQDLAKKAIEYQHIQTKKIEQELAQKTAQDQQEQSLRDMMTQSLPSDRGYQAAGVESPTPSGRAHFEQSKQSGLRSSLVGLVPPSQLAGIAGVETPMDPMVKAYIARAMGGLTQAPSEQGAQPEGSPQAQALPPMDIGITAPPGKQPTVRLNPQRQPLGAESRMFADYQREQQALGKTPAEIRAGWQGVLSGNAGARSGGAETGRLGVRSTPKYQQTERDIAQTRAEGSTAGRPLEAATQKEITGLEGALRQVGVIEKTLDDNFLGPIKGTETSLAVRRRFGNVIGSPMSDNETQFRTALKDVSDQLLRARSGAQINEAEYARLQSMLPQASDEPKVFRSALLRFKTEMGNLIQRKQELGKTPRGALQPGSAPTAQPKTAEEFIKSLVGQ